MKKRLMVLLFIKISLCFSTLSMGQEFSMLREKAKEAIRIRRPNWKLIPPTNETDQEIVYQWGSKDDGVRLLMFHGASRKEAAERMRAALKILSVGPGERLPNLGDEAYIAVSGLSGFTAIRFRKMNVYIDLVAPSKDLAKDLAEFIPDKD